MYSLTFFTCSDLFPSNKFHFLKENVTSAFVFLFYSNKIHTLQTCSCEEGIDVMYRQVGIYEHFDNICQNIFIDIFQSVVCHEMWRDFMFLTAHREINSKDTLLSVRCKG